MHRARELAIKATTSNSLFPLFIEMLNALNSSTNSNSIKVQLCAAYAYSPGQQSKMIARVPRRVVDVEEEDDFKWHSDGIYQLVQVALDEFWPSRHQRLHTCGRNLLIEHVHFFGREKRTCSVCHMSPAHTKFPFYVLSKEINSKVLFVLSGLVFAMHRTGKMKK